MTAMVVSAQEVAEKTGRERKISQFQDRPRHGCAGKFLSFGWWRVVASARATVVD